MRGLASAARGAGGLAVATSLAALLAACGGGAGSGPAGAPAPRGTQTPTPAPPTPTPTPSQVPTPGPTAPSPPPTASAIAHVVIIVQENRSFDNLFSGFPGADAATSGQTHDGQVVPLQPWPFESPGNIEHERLAFLTELAGGRMNGFDLVFTIGYNLPPDFAYSYVPHSDPRSEAGPYWALASRYTLADRMFQSNSSSSYAAHQYLIAAQSGGVIGAPSGVPWGCDAPPGTVTGIGPDGNQPGPFPCFDYNTLATRLDAAGTSWKYYAPSIASHDTGGLLWSAFDASRAVRYGVDWPTKQSSPETNVLKDIAAGALPSVTWVVPSFANSDHPASLSASGPSWVGAILNALGGSPYWKSTAVFILWDDWGGWYDHVLPPTKRGDSVGPGFRVPLIVVSPYAKHGFVSHVEYEYGSVVAFVEWAFHLPTLAQEDLTANALFDCFDFTQKPRRFARLGVPLRARDLLAVPADRRLPDER